LVVELLLIELADVLSRPKFDSYVTVEERQEFLRLLGRAADLIVTGDKDLLALNPFRGIPIITPARYLTR